MIARATIAGTDVLRQEGAGVPLVLLHGIGSDAETWRGVMERLSGRAVLAWDAPGYGASEPLARAHPTPDDYADRLLALLDAAGIARAAIAGHSLGALVAGRFAARAPGRVASLALLSPALGYGVAPGAALPPAVQGRIDELERLGPAAFAAARAARLVARAEALPGVTRAMAAVNPPGYAQAARALGAGDLLADAPSLRGPVRVAVGSEDSVTPPANARRLHDALPEPLELAIVPGCGHALPQEDPDAVAALLGEEPAHAR